MNAKAAAAVVEPDVEEVPTEDQFGREIVGFGVILRKTGDGLSESMETEPKFIKQGDVVYIVYEAVCVDVHYPVENRKEPNEGGVEYVPVLDAVTATFLDRDLVIEAIDSMREKNQERRDAEEAAKEEAKKKGTIFDPEHGGEAAKNATDAAHGEDVLLDDEWDDELAAQKAALEAAGIDTNDGD